MGKKQQHLGFYPTYRYIDDVLSISKIEKVPRGIPTPEFENYLSQMYPAELEIKDTTECTLLLLI